MALVSPFMLGYTRRWPRVISTAIGFVALLASLALNIWSFGNSYNVHASLANRWCELANEWDGLRHERDVLPEDQLLARVRNLRAKQTAIETSEPPSPDENYLRRCQTALNHRLGIDKADIANPAPRNSGLEKSLRR